MIHSLSDGGQKIHVLGEQLHAVAVAATRALEHCRRVGSPKATLRPEGFHQAADFRAEYSCTGYGAVENTGTKVSLT